MKPIVVILVCVLAGACGGSAPPPPELSNAPPAGEPGQTAELVPQKARSGPEFVGTGEAWDGVFVLRDANVTTTAAGEFTRLRASGVTDAGSYLVTGDGKLVLYVERIGDVRLATARPEVYQRSELVPAS